MASVLGNQSFVMAQVLGQFMALVSDAAAVVILLSAVQRKRWAVLLVMCVVITKVVRVASGSSIAEVAYISLLNLLFSVSGAIIALQRPTLVYRQVMAICLLSFIAMVLQVTGVGAWALTFSTYGDSNFIAPVPTVFRDAGSLNYQLVQGRPAGVSYSNVIMSLIILFGFALHFSRKESALRGGTVLLCGVAVLSMAKITFVGLILIVPLVIAFGDHRQKKRVLWAVVLFAMCLGLYSVLFPGLFSTNFSANSIEASFFYRANDIMAALNPDIAFRALQNPYFEGTPQLYMLGEEEYVSGYASLIAKIYDNIVPIAAIMAIGVFMFVRGFIRLNQRFPELTLRVILIIVTIGIFPGTTPIWSANMFWFMAGLGCLPGFYLLRPRFVVQSRRPIRFAQVT